MPPRFLSLGRKRSVVICARTPKTLISDMGARFVRARCESSGLLGPCYKTGGTVSPLATEGNISLFFPLSFSFSILLPRASGGKREQSRRSRFLFCNTDSTTPFSFVDPSGFLFRSVPWDRSSIPLIRAALRSSRRGDPFFCFRYFLDTADKTVQDRVDQCGKKECFPIAAVAQKKHRPGHPFPLSLVFFWGS